MLKKGGNMSFLESLDKNNQYPIIFIGSGITQRYFENAPTWGKLLQQLWSEIRMEKAYFARYKELEKTFNGDDFEVLTTLADELETAFDEQFYNDEIKLENLTPEVAHYQKISPFKTRIANIFKDLKIRETSRKEIKIFTSMLAKARMIVTTNYDEFIEKELNNSIKIRVGNQGLFEHAGDLNELYKIHGSLKKPNSIMITSDDYETMKRTSAIVNAKILSLLTEAPILFIGYSLTDQNIQSLLTDLAENMPFPIAEAAKRIGVVKYEPGKTEVSEILARTSYGVHYTEITTDNFEQIYRSVTKIDQGYSPLEISKYQNAIKQIIYEKGKTGELKQVLTSLIDLDRLPQEMKNQNVVVAFGNEKHLYKIPEYADYVKSYFLTDNDMPQEIALKFIMSMSPLSPLPIAKYLKHIGELKLSDREKFEKRIEKFASLQDIQSKVNVPKATEMQLREYDMSAIDILNHKDDIKARIKIAYFVKNIETIDAKNVIEYILQHESDSFISETNTRKLFMAYSLITEEQSIVKNK